MDGTKQLGSGAIQIRDGIGEVVTPLLKILEPINKNIAQYLPILKQLAASSDPNLRSMGQTLVNFLSQLDPQSAAGVVGQLTQLRDGTVELARQLSDPSAEYLAGVLQLTSGAKELNLGAKQLDDGLGELKAGLPQLKDGVKQLADGSVQLDNGMGELYKGLTDGAKQVPGFNDLAGSADMIARPLDVNELNQQPSQVIINNDRSNKKLSRGAAPLLIILGAFLLSIILWVLLPGVRSKKNYSSQIKNAIFPVLRGTSAAVIGGTVIGFLLVGYTVTIGWRPDSWLASGGVVLFIGITAAVIGQAFVVIFGRALGTLIASCFYMYQLFAFGGVFPAGTTPLAFRFLENLSPMTFARRSLLRAHIGLYDTMFWVSIAMLVVMAVGAVGVAIGTRYFRRKKGQASSIFAGAPITKSVLETS